VGPRLWPQPGRLDRKAHLAMATEIPSRRMALRVAAMMFPFRPLSKQRRNRS
jgi:hypothetical protein